MILLSFGDIFINLYNKLCKKEEKYNLLDTFILGMCFTVIPLSISSLWLPSNQYILFAYITFSIGYWALNKDRLKNYFQHIASTYHNISILQKALLLTAIISILTYVLWSGSFNDAALYHYQHIRWNEEFAAVPGLANIEDRFGFNSNFLLLTSIFTFRFLFGEALYCGLQSLLFVYILCWALIRLFQSSYNIYNIILLIFLFALLVPNGHAIADSNTDVIPNFCIFYLLARIVIEPKSYNKQSLFICILPVTLITFKLSSFIFCIISLIIIINLVKNKNISSVIFLITASILITIPWFIRNIIISGYLVYPLYEIDLFSFDWKLPTGVAMIEKQHIYNWAKNIYSWSINYKELFVGNSVTTIERLSPYLSYWFVIFSPLFIIYSMIKRVKINSNIYIYYFIGLVAIIFWYISAPDPRFIIGCLLGVSFITLYIIIKSYSIKDIHFSKKGSFISIIIVCCFFAFSVKRQQKASIGISSLTNRSISSLYKDILYFPYHTFFLTMPLEEYKKEHLVKYKMDNLTIYVTKGSRVESFDILPCTIKGGLPFEPFIGNKIQSIETIEPRGSHLQDGFRTKKKYIELINKAALETK